MMPTLLGRWQTRLILFLLVALPVSLGCAWLLGRDGVAAREPLVLAALMLAVGLVLDLLYDQLQRLRWDQDWPFALFVLDGVFEFALALAAIRLDGVPGVEACRLARIDRLTRDLVCIDYTLPLGGALAQVAAIIALSVGFVAGLGPVFCPRWRFRGGEFGSFAEAED